MSPDTRPDPLADLLPIIDAAEAAVAAGALPVDVLNITQPVRYAIAHAGVTLTQPRPDAGLREADVLRANLASTADWLDAIIEESDPKPSELMAMVAGIRAALRSTPAAPKEDDRG